MRRNIKGMVLVSVMFIVLVIGLFGRAMLLNGPAMAMIANRGGHELQAQKAAEAGAAYARLQLRVDADWKGNLNGTTVDQADFKVLEDNGNVLGWLRGPTGEVSMFRIRFSYQDGTAAGGDDMPNPAVAHRINTVNLSRNNVRNTANVPVPTVNPSTFAVDDPLVGSPDIPEGAVFLRVEGWAGPTLSAVTGPAGTPAPGHLSSRVLRVIYAAAPGTGAPDAALSAGNGIKIETEMPAVVSVVGTDPLKLRSKKGVDINQWDGGLQILTMDGEVSRDPVPGLNALPAATVTEADETVGDGQDFHNLAWDDVPKASSDPTTTAQIKGGVYICDSAGGYHYYDMSLQDYKDLPNLDPGTGLKLVSGAIPPKLSDDFREVRPPGNVGAAGGIEVFDVAAPFTIEITADVNVETSPGGQDGVVFSTIGGRKLHKNDAAGNYEVAGVNPLINAPGAMTLKNATISAVGDMSILLDVKGENGSLTTEGTAVVAAPSIDFIQDSTPYSQRLSIYAKEDLIMSTYRDSPGFPPYVPPYEGYGPLSVEGLVYAWGDAQLLTGTPGEQYTDQFDMLLGAVAPNYGEVNITGALVAYGANPENWDPLNPATTGPGSAGDGEISITGMAANITYDKTKLIDPSLIPAGGLQELKRQSYGFER